MMLKRPGPSPAAPSVEASRPPSLNSDASGVGETTSRIASTPSGRKSRSTTSRTAQPVEVVTVLGERRSDHVRACCSRELDEEAADAAGRSDDQNGLALSRRERVEGRERRERGERRCPSAGKVQAWRLRRYLVVFRDDDQVRPAALVRGRVGMADEAEDLVADLVPADVGAHLVDDTGESRPRTTGNT